MRGEKQKEHLADIWWFPWYFPTNFFEKDVKNKSIRLNTGYWHGTILGVSLKRTSLPANSPGFLVHHFLCCLALHHSSSIPLFAHSCPAAGGKAVLLPSPIKHSPQNFRRWWLLLSSQIQTMWNPGCLIFIFTYTHELCMMHMEKKRYMISGSILSCFFMYFP